MAPRSTGSWEGSIITEGHIEYLRWTRKLSSKDVVAAHVPGEEHVPEPGPDEHIFLGTHFLVGFGLPGISFIQHFLELYGLQIHHLGVNFILYLVCFVTLCKVYLFYFPDQMHREVAYSRGGAVVYRRLGRPLPKMKWKESFKKW
ncbi:dead-box atp-dependent rna helicase 40 [Hordeum vulgare]|nr:dead-box atp-dependent rna helicase 40 [Hordeum vulgare]